ncbi:hypothetical protein NARC_110079 [Candidatus Nitrosocosmicus arcticus]|uniref:Uncharacterized protein n=1 Tax=Candidatus Nitrosocosmicus arcticus TaxID=2035267 RepID=A0A557STC7_9ARCH|nr:hypothetical protein NARC_110079 [Candidatus Nitrosocosmicus arcticus]
MINDISDRHTGFIQTLNDLNEDRNSFVEKTNNFKKCSQTYN